MKRHTKKAVQGRQRSAEHEKTHGLRDLALILGVGRERLTRALNDAQFKTSEKMTVARAFTALSAKFQREGDRDRRQKAEADTAEITAAEKRGLLMLKKDVRLLWADLTIDIRKLVQSQSKWESEKLLLALSKIKIQEPK